MGAAKRGKAKCPKSKCPTFRVCYSVGELIEALKRLPPEMPIGLNEEGTRPTVFNWGVPLTTAHLDFTDADAFPEDDLP